MPSAEQSGVGIDSITEADWILVGHSHFDHLYGAERIAVQTGATVVGSYESIRIMAEAGVPEAQLMPVSGGETVSLGPEITARVLPSMHSCTWATDPMPAPDQTCIGDLKAILAAAGRGHHNGEPVQGTLADFIAEQAALLGEPDPLLLCHHDNWLPGFSRPTDIEPIRRAVAQAAPSTSVVELGYCGGYLLLIQQQ